MQKIITQGDQVFINVDSLSDTLEIIQGNLMERHDNNEQLLR